MTTTISKERAATGLRKLSKPVLDLDRRILHARQLFGERIARAESDYADAVGRAYAAASQIQQPVNTALDLETLDRDRAQEIDEGSPAH